MQNLIFAVFYDIMNYKLMFYELITVKKLQNLDIKIMKLMKYFDLKMMKIDYCEFR